MKRLLLLLLLALSSSVVYAQATRAKDAIRRAQSLFTETIPHLELKDASFEVALKMIRRSWEERHPNGAFPVAATDYGPSRMSGESYPARITLDLKDVAFMEALSYVGSLTGRRLHPKSRAFGQGGHPWIDEDWTTQAHEVTPAALAALQQLTPDSTARDLRRTFERLGVKLQPWMKVVLSESGRELVATSFREQEEEIEGVLVLLSNGWKITK